jgi:hypothetical protein
MSRERKFDGWRALVTCDDGVSVRTRSGRGITAGRRRWDAEGWPVSRTAQAALTADRYSRRPPVNSVRDNRCSASMLTQPGHRTRRQNDGRRARGGTQIGAYSGSSKRAPRGARNDRSACRARARTPCPATSLAAPRGSCPLRRDVSQNVRRRRVPRVHPQLASRTCHRLAPVGHGRLRRTAAEPARPGRAAQAAGGRQRRRRRRAMHRSRTGRRAIHARLAARNWGQQGSPPVTRRAGVSRANVGSRRYHETERSA